MAEKIMFLLAGLAIITLVVCWYIVAAQVGAH